MRGGAEGELRGGSPDATTGLHNYPAIVTLSKILKGVAWAFLGFALLDLVAFVWVLDAAGVLGGLPVLAAAFASGFAWLVLTAIANLLEIAVHVSRSTAQGAAAAIRTAEAVEQIARNGATAGQRAAIE
jgi:hypothetical protein